MAYGETVYRWNRCVSEKLLNSQDRDLRRALFSLKQIFQVRSQAVGNEWLNLVHSAGIYTNTDVLYLCLNLKFSSCANP